MLLATFPATVFLSAMLAADLRSARTLLQKGQIEGALREIEAALRDRPDDPEVQYQAGEILRAMGDDRAERLLKLAPDSAEAHQILGKSFESRGQLDEALKEYKAELGKNADTPGLHFLVGNVFWKKREFSEAVPELEAELRLNPDHALANLRLGEILLSLDQPGKAVEHLQRTVRANDASVEAHAELGKAYRALGQHQQALEQFRVVAERWPNDTSVHAQLAGEYRALGDAQRAKAELELHRRLLQEKAGAARKK